MLTMIEEEFCRRKSWLEEKEVIDYLALVNSLPGIIGINISVIIGRKLLGTAGAVVAAIGVLLPSFFIILGLSEVVLLIREYPLTGWAFLGVRAGATGLILTVMFRLFKKTFEGWREIFLAVNALFCLKFVGISAIQVILLSALLGLILYRKKKE